MNLIVRENVSLAEFTTFKIGGAARFFVSAKTENEIVEALKFAEEKSFAVFVFGGGSNVLIADEGFGGLALQISNKGISTSRETDGTVRVTAQAGEDWEEFVAFCVNENLAGVECLSGIPGFTGGTPVQNVGAYGQEVSETIFSVRCFDQKKKEIVELSNAECGFAYRASIFNTTAKNRFVVTAVTFALKSGGAPKIVYRDLQNYFAGKKPSLSETRAAVLEIRRAKSMVIDEKDPNSRSAGSFFKNPIVSNENFAEVEKKAKSLGIIGENENLPSFKADDENVKIPAAWLIEKSGFQKGFRMGNVGLSTKHTLAIVNFGNGTAREILALKEEIQSKVEEKFGVLLCPEPNFISFD